MTNSVAHNPTRHAQRTLLTPPSPQGGEGKKVVPLAKVSNIKKETLSSLRRGQGEEGNDETKSPT